MLRIALLDDHPAVLAGLRRLLDAEPDLTVAAAARDGQELAARLDAADPDVVVLDHDLAGEDGLAICLRIKRRRRSPAVVVYSASTGPALTLAARAAGAGAVVDKAEPVQRLLRAIRAAAAGGCVMPALSRDAYAAAVERVDDEDLPVLAMLLDGAVVEDIAAALRRPPAEVAWRVQRIVGRLGPAARHAARGDAATTIGSRPTP